MRVKILKLIRQNIGVRYEIKLIPTETLLHLNIIEAESIFASDFVTLWEVVDPLKLIESLIKEALAGRGRPKNIPLM